MRFRTKPFEIEAVQFTGDNFDEVLEFVGNEGDYNDHEFSAPPGPGFALTDKFGDEQTAQVYDKLHSTWVGVKPTDWIIKGQKGEFYPCDHDIFVAKYEEIVEKPSCATTKKAFMEGLRTPNEIRERRGWK